jgi:type IV fimbrial biogenesis protein FimT
MNRTAAQSATGTAAGAICRSIAARHGRGRHELKQPRRGVTLIESLICITILLITLSSVLPGFGEALERRRVEGAAAQLTTDIHLTRSLSVAQNRTLRLEIGRDATGTCYMVHTGSAGDCTCAPQGAICQPGVELHRSVHLPGDDGVAVFANVRSMVFERTRGTVTPTGTLRVEGARVSVRQIVNIMGRVRSCSPDGSMPGYKVC